MPIIIRNGSLLFCDHCGGEFKLKLPMPVNEIIEKMQAFKQLHKDCVKTWQQPQPDMNQSEYERVVWWWNYGEHGLSSEAIYYTMIRSAKVITGHPYDPDDFRRCYLLLEAVPEWKERLDELKVLSKQWSNLVDNWDKLTGLLEEQMKTGKPNGMYELMQNVLLI
jgi:hypothetical protein